MCHILRGHQFRPNSATRGMVPRVATLVAVAHTWCGGAITVVAEPRLILLDALPGGLTAQASAISSDGPTAAGFYTLIDPSRTRAVRWTGSGAIHDLGVLTGAAFSYCGGISADGTTVVGSSGSTGAIRALRWTAASGMQDLGVPAGAVSAYGLSVSADGSVVSGATEPVPGVFRAFRWTLAGGMQELGALPDRPSSIGSAISADGLTVVGSSDSSSDGRAFRWMSAGGMTDLGVLPGGAYSRAVAASGDGAVVVGYSGSFEGQRAVRWTSADQPESLGVLAGGTHSYAFGVSGDGMIVVGTGSSARGDRGFIWTPALRMVDFADFLTARGVSLAGWSSLWPHAISVSGTSITGGGRFNNRSRVWMVQDLPPFCVADFDHSGDVTVGDVFEFLSAFFMGDSRADLNGSGVVSVQDMFHFLEAYFVGCV